LPVTSCIKKGDDMDFNKPGPNKRVCAFFIDSILGQILSIMAFLIFPKYVDWLVWAVYLLLKDCVHGQSIGKCLVGTQVVDENNAPARPSKAIIRNIFMVIPIMPLVEYILILRDKAEGRRVGDRVAKTRVNDLKPETSDRLFLWISVLLLIIVLAVQIAFSLIILSKRPDLIKR
jgi:uncharacterized RDD family membrane protein YckC